MKKLFACVIVAAMMMLSFASFAQSQKMDGWLRILQNNPAQGKALLSKAVSTTGDTTFVACFVKSSNVALTEAAITDAGGTVRTKLKTILTARIPIDALATIAAREEVVAIEAAKPVATKMNAARAFTQVDIVQAGTGLDKAYKGSGVLVGAVDDGLNWTNADFSGRIQWLEQTDTGGTLYTCDKSDIDGDSCPVTDGGGTVHGTHVTGIAAGANGTYTGVAPEAWIAFAFNAAQDAESGGTFATAVVDGVNDLFAVADTLDVATVVNLSLGTSLGAHDNSSLLESGLNELVAGARGRIITNAAGNENVNPNPFETAQTGSSAFIGGIHAGVNVTAGADKGWRMGIWSANVATVGGAIADVWLADGDASNCVIDVKAYNVSGTFPYPPPTPNVDTGAAKITTGNVVFPTVTPAVASDAGNKVTVTVNTFAADGMNNKPHAIVQIARGSSGAATDLATFGYDIIIRANPGTTCTGDIWLYPDRTSYLDFLKGISSKAVVTGANGAGYGYMDGDSFKTTTIPGTASGVITVGSYMGRGTWVDINGVTRYQNVYDSSEFGTNGGGTGGTVGQVSLFSSLGPTADGRHKPEIVAPGEPILSTLAEGITPDESWMGDSNHWKLEGTSMASPHVAGIVALLLQKNNCLTVDEVKAALQSTAAVGTLTSYTTDAEDTYGSGIVNALAAMQAIAADASCYSGGGGGGGSGCGGMLVPATPMVIGPAVALLLSPIAVIVWRRKKRG